MTVGELIEKLRDYDDTSRVRVWDDGKERFYDDIEVDYFIVDEEGVVERMNVCDGDVTIVGF